MTQQPQADCHVHIFDPTRFPYTKDTDHTPHPNETATREALLQVIDAHGTSHALIVTPTAGYGTDNVAALDAISLYPDRFRGIAVVPPGTSIDDLAGLKSRGIVGARIDLVNRAPDFIETMAPLIDKLSDLDMVIQIHTEKCGVSRIAETLKGTKGRVVFDHMGRPDAGLGVTHPDFQALLRLADRDETYVKLSGPFRFSRLGTPFADGDGFAHAILKAFGPERCVWGSDWPFVRMQTRLDYGPALSALDRWCDDDAARRTILWETPRRLFGFGKPLCGTAG